jgi:hypothetical protein
VEPAGEPGGAVFELASESSAALSCRGAIDGRWQPTETDKSAPTTLARQAFIGVGKKKENRGRGYIGSV